MIKIVAFLLLLFIIYNPLLSQDLNYVKEVVRTLSSKNFHGRGYVENGDILTAKYIRSQLKNFRVQPFHSDYFQSYHFEVNTFPGAMEVSIDGKALVAGTDYMIDPSSAPLNGTFEIFKIDSSFFTSSSLESILKKTALTNKFIFLDTVGWKKDKFKKTLLEIVMASDNPLKIKGFILGQEKELFWWGCNYQSTNCGLLVKKSVLGSQPKEIKIRVNSNLKNHKAVNVHGWIPGQIDSFIVITAHFDHLGRMGKNVYFPGASDNASGTGMVLDFAREFSSQNKPRYNIVFLFFSGEEIGLLGSRYFVEHPLFPLEKIKMLLNLDMEGTGAQGVVVCHCPTISKEYNKLDSLNRHLNLNMQLRPRGPSLVNDFYSFYQNGVPGMYVYTDDKSQPYHSPNDSFEKLSFALYEPLFKLLMEYIKTY